MALSAESGGVIRFQGFELNPQTGELRKNGIRLSLQDQPFKVLVLLLQRPGEMVTREELRQLIWPEESFGDFDNAINRSVAKLRGVLGDSPDVPHLIETLPRRGYRFIGTVDGHGKKPPQPLVSSLETEAVATPRVHHLWRTAIIVVGSIAVALVLGIWWSVSPRQPHVLKSAQLTNTGKNKCCLVTDGSRIFFNEDDSDHTRVKYIPVTGGDPIVVPLTSPELSAGLMVEDIFPNHDKLLVDTFAALWSVPLTGPLGSSPRRLVLPRYPQVSYAGAAWSPDGELLAFASGSDIYLARSDGTEPHKLLTAKGIVKTPVWSPDGRSLRFTLSNPEVGSIFEVSAAGGEPHEVTPHWKDKSLQVFGRWSPDGKYFVFLAGANGRADLWAIREHPSFLSMRAREPVRLTAGPVRYDSLAFGSDGKKIFTQGIELRGELQRYDPKSREFQPFLEGLSADCCVYSNDGQWIAYVTFPEGSLWRSRPDGSQRQQLTWPPMGALNPHWSPDGKEIAFTGFLPSKVSKTFVMSAEGGDPRQLTQNDCPELEANWSPDGKRLTFGVFLHFVSDMSCPVVLYSMDLKTDETSTIPGSEGLWAPRWSPDGTRIVAEDSYDALKIYDVKTQKWSELVRASLVGIGFPQWSRDGKLVYYVSGNGIYSIRITDHKITTLVSMPAKTTGNSGYWTYFDPDGNPFVLRDVSLDEIYALDIDLP